MSEDLNLPASLQRLEITPERSDVTTNSEDNPFAVSNMNDNEAECFLENLSLEAICSKGNCQCNKKKEKEEAEVMKKLKRIQKRPVLRRSRLYSSVLRPPVLKLGDIKQTGGSDNSLPLSEHSPKPESHYPVSVLREDAPECSSGTTLGGGKSLLRPPILRPQPHLRPATRHLIAPRSCSEESTLGRGSAAMCAVQARNPSPDDTNIEELASYFDLFVHIPKKMSLMAEMMYI